MQDKRKFFKDPKYFGRVVHACILVLLIIFEIIVFVQYVNNRPRPSAGLIIALAACLIALVVLCTVEMYGVKTLTGRIVIYVWDFLLLLAICSITGSAYLSALYCVILTEIYINLEVLRTKAIIFGVSCGGFIVTCVLGWLISHGWSLTPDEIVNLISDGLVGAIIFAVHFALANFLIEFYNTNLKLTAALKEADERKAELENAYKELSETAVFQERNRIARDIHDNAGHSMTAVIMQTEAAKLLIDTNPEEAKSKIVSANMQAKNALEQMRESVHLLAGRDSARSLKQELEEILAQTMDGTDVNIRADIADIELPWDRRHYIANSLKECLSNGIRHGGATAFYVELSQEGVYAKLTVSDNGCGLPSDFKEGFGMRGIREKATAFGGRTVVESEQDDGCEVTIVIKLNEKSGETQS